MCPDGTPVINNEQVVCIYLGNVKMLSGKCKYDADAFSYVCGQILKWNCDLNPSKVPFELRQTISPTCCL